MLYLQTPAGHPDIEHLEAAVSGGDLEPGLVGQYFHWNRSSRMCVELELCCSILCSILYTGQ